MRRLFERPRPARLRIASLQYLLRPISRFEDFATHAEFFVQSPQKYRSQFVLFPESMTMQLVSYLGEPSPARAVRRLAQLAPDCEALFQRLATQTGMYIIAGTHPTIQHYAEYEERRHVRAESSGAFWLCQNVSILSGGEDIGIETRASKIPSKPDK